MKELKSTLLHTLELMIVLSVAYLLAHFFNLNSENSEIIIATIIGAFVKFARVSPDVPIDDYVNPKQ